MAYLIRHFLGQHTSMPGPVTLLLVGRAFAALGLTIGGIPGVLRGAYVVKSMPLDVIRWLVAVVVLYVAVSRRREAAR